MVSVAVKNRVKVGMAVRVRVKTGILNNFVHNCYFVVAVAFVLFLFVFGLIFNNLICRTILQWKQTQESVCQVDNNVNV